MRQLMLLVAVTALSGCLSTSEPVNDPSDPATETFAPITGVDISKMTKTGTGVYYQDLVVGTGDSLSTLRIVDVTFTGYLKTGAIFDQLLTDRAFDLNAAIVGLAEGMIGMKVGGLRKIVIPSARAYGQYGLPAFGIPGNATLIYDMKLVSLP